MTKERNEKPFQGINLFLSHTQDAAAAYGVAPMGHFTIAQGNAP